MRIFTQQEFDFHQDGGAEAPLFFGPRATILS